MRSGLPSGGTGLDPTEDPLRNQSREASERAEAWGHLLESPFWEGGLGLLTSPCLQETLPCN